MGGPEAGVDDVQEALARTTAEFQSMPEDLRAGIPKSDMVARIKRDMALLVEAVAKRGTLGEAMIPDAFEPITQSASIAFDDNAVSVCFATASHCFQVLLSML